jgi:hypothetical protein
MKEYSTSKDFFIFAIIPYSIVGFLILIYVIVTSKSDTYIFEYFIGPVIALMGIAGTCLFRFYSLGIKYIIDDDFFCIKRFNKTIMKVPHNEILGISKLEKRRKIFTLFFTNERASGIIDLREGDIQELYDKLTEIIKIKTKANKSYQSDPEQLCDLSKVK